MKVTPSPFRVDAYITYLKARISVLEARLLALGMETATGAWIVGFSPQERSMLEMLSSAYPRFISLYDLEERLSGRDHARDRDVRIVRVIISRIKSKLGKDVIVNEPGTGYRLGVSPADLAKRAQERIGDPLHLGPAGL